NTVRNRKVFSGDDRNDSRQREGSREVNVLYKRMRQMTTQNLAIEHARQKNIIGKLRLARALRARVDFAEGFADYLEWLSVVLFVIRHSTIAIDNSAEQSLRLGRRVYPPLSGDKNLAGGRAPLPDLRGLLSWNRNPRLRNQQSLNHNP